MKNRIYNEQNGLWYELQIDYYIPYLATFDEEQVKIGVWGQRHLRYLKQHRKVSYYNLLISGFLNGYIGVIFIRNAKYAQKKSQYFSIFSL